MIIFLHVGLVEEMRLLFQPLAELATHQYGLPHHGRL
jgi:hypothetical protein